MDGAGGAKLVVGCGYLGRRAAERWRQAGCEVVAVTRSHERAGALAAARLQPLVADVTRPETLEPLAQGRLVTPQAIDAALFAVGYDRTGGPGIETVYAEGVANVLAALPATVERFIYISTTGVYGSAAGDWVDEQTPPDPQREGGRASLAAEQRLGEQAIGRRSAILRLAGIYGPGRVPYLDKLRAGEPIPAPAEGWLNLIHVDDAARIVLAVDAWLRTRPQADGPHVFCVSDGAPAVRGQYYAEVARLLGAPPPRFTAPPAGSPVAARAAVDRRVRSTKLERTLGVALEFPSYREGLAAILGDASGAC
jgi:nucleoside-diphosphate-sugar epimerase